MRRSPHVLSKFKTLFLASAITVMAASMIIFPQESLEASIRGLDIWWKIVFPSLLPFFIVSELLIGFGVVNFIGVLLEPLMRPLFRVPGVGGFVWAMGMASGSPSGAKLTARLRQEKQLTKIEAERLVSFTNSSNPLFIFGAVSVGFFYNPQLGLLLAAAHYLGNFTVGLIMRFHGGPAGRKHTADQSEKKASIREAFAVLHKTRINDDRPIGKLLGDAVMSSIQTLLMIGGFIILFSVLNKLLYLLYITNFLAGFVETLLQFTGLSLFLSMPLISGLFEITMGIQITSQVQEASLMQQIIITSFILGFSGLSIQAQVASILAQTDIRFRPFFTARLMHGFFAGLYTFILWTPLYLNNIHSNKPANSLPVLSWLSEEGINIADIMTIAIQSGPAVTIFSLIFYILIYMKRNKLY